MTAKRLKTASPRLTLDVTRELIDQAKPRDSGHCMLADAVAAAAPNARFISVDLATIRFSDPVAGIRYVYLTPRLAQDALLKFDQGEPIEPFRTKIEGAHVLATGQAQKARASLERDPQHSKSSGHIPTRVGGRTPPRGPLATGFKGRAPRTARRREFGLRAMIR